MYKARQQRTRDAFDIAEAESRAAGIPFPFEPAPPSLPALDQVTEWRKGKG